MKRIVLFIPCLTFFVFSYCQTFSSIIPDSTYIQFFLFDKKKNEIGIFCENIYDNPELRPNAKYREGDPFSENYARLRRFLSTEDYDFFQKQSKSCVVNEYEGYIGQSNYFFKRKKNRIIFKKLKNRTVHRWYSVPLFNLEKNLALVYSERRFSGCLEVFMFKDGVWQSEFEIICWIE